MSFPKEKENEKEKSSLSQTIKYFFISITHRFSPKKEETTATKPASPEHTQDAPSTEYLTTGSRTYTPQHCRTSSSPIININNRVEEVEKSPLQTQLFPTDSYDKKTSRRNSVYKS